jgi:hypothetical protein
MPRNNPNPGDPETPDRPEYKPERNVSEHELDESVEESFPASDPPAHSVAKPKEPPADAGSCPCDTAKNP